MTKVALGWSNGCQWRRERENREAESRERERRETGERERESDAEEEGDMLSLFLMPKTNVICLESPPLFCVFFPHVSSVLCVIPPLFFLPFFACSVHGFIYRRTSPATVAETLWLHWCGSLLSAGWLLAAAQGGCRQLAGGWSVGV